MKVQFTELFYNEGMRGRVKTLPLHLAKDLIKQGMATEVKEDAPTEIKERKPRKPKV